MNLLQKLFAVCLIMLMSITSGFTQNITDCDVGSVPTDVNQNNNMLQINLNANCNDCRDFFSNGQDGCAVIEIEAAFVSGCASLQIEVMAVQNEEINYYYNTTTHDCAIPDEQSSQDLGSSIQIDINNLEMVNGMYYILVCSQSTGNRSFRITCVCPDLTGQAPEIVINMESSCELPDVLPSGGSLSAPITACPNGSTLEYSVDGGDWATNLPVYDDLNSLTIRTRCLCSVDNNIISSISTVVTTPGSCPDPACPVDLLDFTAPPIVLVNDSECPNFGDMLLGGKFAAPTMDLCLQNSTLQYSVNGGVWTVAVPDYVQNQSISVRTRCNCNANTEVSSLVNTVVTNPGACPLCPDDLTISQAPEVIINDSQCSQDFILTLGEIISPVELCPDGSTLEYSTDGVDWSENIPTYSQDMALAVMTRCNCELDNGLSSLISTVNTNPSPCNPIPTMSQWMLFILALIISSISLVFIGFRNTSLEKTE